MVKPKAKSFCKCRGVFTVSSKALHALTTDFWEQEHTFYLIRRKRDYNKICCMLGGNIGIKSNSITLPKVTSETEYWNQPPEDIHDAYKSELTLKGCIEEYNINLNELR